MTHVENAAVARRPGSHTTVREGAATGMLGAAGVALWFLLVDTVAGHPLFTPGALGSMLFSTQPMPGPESPVDPALVAGYTVVHCLAFVAAGMVAVRAVHLAERQPAVLALLLVFFGVFELAFYGLTAVLDTTGVLGVLAWWQVAAGNLIATALMGGYLWHRHPGMAGRLDAALSH